MRACFAPFLWRNAKESWVKQEEKRTGGENSEGDTAGVCQWVCVRDLTFAFCETGSRVRLLSRGKIQFVF